MATLPTWHGTDEESGDLLNAVRHSCACKYDPEGQLESICTAHDALAHDQGFLDRLLFARRMRGRWIYEEFAE